MQKIKQIILLITILFSNIADAKFSPENFLGTWCWEHSDVNKKTFKIFIKRDGNTYQGSYLAVALNGERIDGNDLAFQLMPNNIKTNTIRAKLKGVEYGSVGLVELSLRTDNKLKWHVL